jgi:hypothetical protein
MSKQTMSGRGWPKEGDLSPDAKRERERLERNEVAERRETRSVIASLSAEASKWREQLMDRSAQLVERADELAQHHGWEPTSVYRTFVEGFDDAVQQERRRAVRAYASQLNAQEERLITNLGITKEDYLRSKLGDAYTKPEGKRTDEDAAWDRLSDDERKLCTALGISATEFKKAATDEEDK